jgi:hypothetical protein
MPTEMDACTAQCAADGPFWSRVLAPDAGHLSTALFSGEAVHRVGS